MNINLDNFKNSWFEDENGNVYHDQEEKQGKLYYHSCFPCQISEEVCVYDYHPKGINKILIKLPMLSERIKKKIGRTFKPLCTFNTTYHSEHGQKCIIAMVNSGDYTLEQAIWVYTSACERCMNVLLHKYLGTDGYEEYSSEWHKANTHCDFCKYESERLEAE